MRKMASFFMVYYYLFGVFYLSKLLFSGFIQFKGYFSLYVSKITQNNKVISARADWLARRLRFAARQISTTIHLHFGE